MLLILFNCQFYGSGGSLLVYSLKGVKKTLQVKYRCWSIAFVVALTHSSSCKSKSFSVCRLSLMEIYKWSVPTVTASETQDCT